MALSLQGNYQALARKYRPQNFEDVVGQEHVINALKNSILLREPFFSLLPRSSSAYFFQSL